MPSPSVSAQAALAFEKGLWPVAEIGAQEAIRENPADAAAWNLLGRIAMHPAVNMPDHAARFFERALSAAPGFKPAAKNLAAARAQPRPAPPPPRGEGRVLIRDWGWGFFSEVAHVVGGLLFAEITGRVPSVHWGPLSLFHSGEPNAWDTFFEPIGTAIDTTRPGSIFPSKWSSADLTGPVPNRWEGQGSRLPAFSVLERPEQTVVLDFLASVHALRPWLPAAHPLANMSVADITRHLVLTRLRPRAEIVARVDEFARSQFAGRPMIAAHLRGSDKSSEMVDGPRLLEELWRALDDRTSRNPDAGIFVLTDSVPMLEEAAARFGRRLVTAPAARTADTTGVHYTPGHNRRRLGEEVLTDALLACRCDSFVGLGYSNVGCFIRSARAWAPDACTLIGPAVDECPLHEIYLCPPPRNDPR